MVIYTLRHSNLEAKGFSHPQDFWKAMEEKKPSLIVVGKPKNMDGSEGFRAQKCALFADKLRQETGISTVMWDERLTTVSAHKALNETNTRGKDRKNVIDAVSAVMILEDFLRHRKNT